MTLSIPYRVDEKDLKHYRLTQGVYIVGRIGHLLAVLGFISMGVMEMVWFNLVVSVPAFALALIWNRLGRHSIAFAAAIFELYVHQLLGIYYLGWEFGVQFWLIAVAGLSFFNARWRPSVQYLLLGLAIIGFVLMYIYRPEGTYVFSETLMRQAYALNGAVIIVYLAMLINYFAKATLKAENRLIEEKEVTERQNEQLREQHRSLTLEQDKSFRMLNKIKALFGQQVSEEVAQEMIHSDSEIDSKIHDVTVMFLDIRDFTLFADSQEPADVATFQNIVFDKLINIVKEQRGIVSQILGDGIMAVFGAPAADERHAEHAVSAGYTMLREIEALGKRGEIPPIRVGIGLNSGKVLAGNIGNDIRKFYSLTGTNVIIAARIEQLNKQYDSQFLVSRSTFEATKRMHETVESLGALTLKGIERKIGVHKLA